MTAHAMNHFTILAEDLRRTCDFYRDLLGLTEGYRPDMGFPGAWLYAGETAVLHVVSKRPLPAQRAGVLDHMAFSASGLAETVMKLKQRGIQYRLDRQVETGTWQLFLHDPNGAKVELDFPAAEPEPA
ncbi:MAG: VOC family protein [Rhodospirillaceae bacterium]|jgi:catechol 2,3-dioxygenase-like lactoylglutathione lyase family enzyme|nr:VOC family protein [Rhodospirillaceae bacterium]